MNGWAARRWVAMLLVYPLAMSAIAFDTIWAMFVHRWWPPVVYTAGVAVIATALVVGTNLVRGIPRVACCVVMVVSLATANTSLVMTASELTRGGRSFESIAVIGGGISVASFAVTALVVLGAETVARRVGGPSESCRDAVAPPAVGRRPVPTLVDPVAPTLVDPFEAPTAVGSVPSTAETRSAA
ncbi:hypothetical protein E1218_10765 [Kribbella turkmenica]|uniref:Uncharacterized protein n=1 Tax=Kribbella turkmenica TaxID=2530375 RepID=A0A4R4XA16_9ACTN|nr:hypothetical protein [Kribbella turkmenica]TDD27305.1 hypothetical protein E1218_10765 [Kribbella turkmenica]